MSTAKCQVLWVTEANAAQLWEEKQAFVIDKNSQKGTMKMDMIMSTYKRLMNFDISFDKNTF